MFLSNYFHLTVHEAIIVSVLLVSFLVQLVYWLGIYSRIIRRPAENEGKDDIPVSVIICARNEAENLRKHLPAILEQDHTSYEVVVVNHCSEDETEDILESLKKKYSHLRSTLIHNNSSSDHGKKLALTLGLKAAKNEWVLLTDADCRPASCKWISVMQKHFINEKSIVLGYGKYAQSRGFLNKIIRMDTLFTGIQYLSFAMAGFPYMGVGRNLAYRRSLFFGNKGFASHLKLKSGDDDLFVNETAQKANTTVEYSHPAHTISIPSATWGEWIQQKKRHLTTGFYYRKRIKWLLGGEISSRLLFYMSVIYIAAASSLHFFALLLLLLRLLIQLLILKFGAIRLNEKKLLLISPLYDIFIPIINMTLSIANYFSSRRNKWK